MRRYYRALVEALNADPGVDRASPPFPSDEANPEASEAYLIQVIPTTSPQDAATEETVKRLRADVIAPVVEGSTATANVTGAVPGNIDFTGYLAGRLIIFLGVVLALSFFLAHGRLPVPARAPQGRDHEHAVDRAAYGDRGRVFQWGWLDSIFGIEPAPIEPFIPMMMFAIVFGLSMDYEVFLLSRVKEEYRHAPATPANSVADGLAATARVITAAAAIMVVVFGSFVFEDDRIIKLFGLGLSMAVLLDATSVRMLLVPATMELLGSPQLVAAVVARSNSPGAQRRGKSTSGGHCLTRRCRRRGPRRGREDRRQLTNFGPVRT